MRLLSSLDGMTSSEFEKAVLRSVLRIFQQKLVTFNYDSLFFANVRLH